MKVIDLSVAIRATDWEPEPIEHKVIGHVEGARMLGRSYLYFTCKHWLSRLYARVFRRHLLIEPSQFPDRMGLSLMSYRLSTHTGTHIDSPWHYGWREGAAEPPTITDLPLEQFYGDGVLLDVSAGAGRIDALELEQAAQRAGHVFKPGEIALVRTGADALYGSREYFCQYRYFSPEAITWLIAQGVKVIGTDAFSFDAPFTQMIDSYLASGNASTLWPAHFIGRDTPYAQIERLANLGDLPRPRGFKVSCFPIKLDKADAAWCRAVALFE
ncbi:cyclase family protein [Pseudomonas sp. KNUC1026]|uniref:cyclase family protein n=1 Tax=Pseudomonas sp. KNUC1026 TaxID=2893890 RepID=UPI001F35F61E|nr:cyclase family protein [Pseudomonas sp. KNUC1026]UFH50196.1 cyclase family protein [Pseudomonas sp. KNUC1026]